MISQQQEAVLDYIRRYGSIGSWEAFMDLGITRLSAVIFCLRKKGYSIISKSVTRKNRFGKSVIVSEYSLGKQL